jgi:UDP-N-acetylglucosamine acyltransferase
LWQKQILCSPWAINLKQMKKIHSTAIISKKAKLGKNVSVGPYSIIEDNVIIGDETKIGAYCVIHSNSSIGKFCNLFTGAIVGSPPQDLKYKGAKSYLEIGDYNTIREYCTFNPGTEEGGKTSIGNHNLFMAYAHVAHDCKIGDHCVLANCGTLAGHVTLEDHVIISGLVAVHQFVRVGRLSIVGGCSKVVQDIPPFSTCDGHPARVYGLNLIGLRRKGIPKASVEELKRAFKTIFNSGLNIKHAVDAFKKGLKPCPEAAHLLSFIENAKRGLTRSCRSE